MPWNCVLREERPRQDTAKMLKRTEKLINANIALSMRKNN